MTLSLVAFICSYLITGALTNWTMKRCERTYHFSKWQRVCMIILSMCFATFLGLVQLDFQSYGQDAIYFPATIYLEMIAIAPLFVLCLTDLKAFDLPDELNQLFFGLGFIYLLCSPTPLWEGIICAVLLFVLFFSIAFVTGAMGGGDIKYVGGAGLWLNVSQTIAFLYCSFFTAAIYGILLVVFFRYKKEDPLPFGPFLIFSSLALFFIN